MIDFLSSIPLEWTIVAFAVFVFIQFVFLVWVLLRKGRGENR